MIFPILIPSQFPIYFSHFLFFQGIRRIGATARRGPRDLRFRAPTRRHKRRFPGQFPQKLRVHRTRREG